MSEVVVANGAELEAPQSLTVTVTVTVTVEAASVNDVSILTLDVLTSK